MTAHVPEGMSSVDAFNALYENAIIIGMGKYATCSGQTPGTPWNTIQIFKRYCYNDFCDYVRGKYMKVDFQEFPELDVTGYDRKYGPGSAQKAIDTYQQTMDKSDLKYDLNCEPCTYFTSYWKKRTPEYERKDLNEMFRKCENLEETENRLQNQVNKINSSFPFSECKVEYALVSPPINYISHDYKPCQVALDHIKMLLENRMHENTTVDGLSICRYNRFMPFLQRCEKLTSEVSLNTARKILESHISKQ